MDPRSIEIDNIESIAGVPGKAGDSVAGWDNVIVPECSDFSGILSEPTDPGVLELPSGSSLSLPDDGLRDAGLSEAAAEFYLGCLQALLFVAGRPVTAADAARAVQLEISTAEGLLKRLAEEFHPGGLQIVAVAGGYQMTTRPECAAVLARFLEPLPQRLSQPALETLALIAYRQPLTQPEIESVRGVKSDSCIRTLLDRGLIEDAGRKDVIGRPILYRTTEEFLIYLGIPDLGALPPMEAAFPDTIQENEVVSG